ncbi:MAG: glycosyltransferase [Woeseiaceae bacterium]|nr:glycosyltransferase [Woeseiaceae bacterium]
MKALLLSAGSSIHTARWANGLSRAGVDICLATQHPVSQELDPGVDVIQFPHRGNPGYVMMAAQLRRVTRVMRPDILNVHFASGYGTTGRLINWHPYLLSVWGSDVFSFPERSPLHRRLVAGNLKAADVVASTSRCMADQVRTLVPAIGDIPITPFGIDVESFSSVPAISGEPRDTVVIGTVKAMEDVYGIDTLIEAFRVLYEKLVADGDPLANRIELRLIGGGSRTDALRHLAERLEMRDRITFVGQVPHANVPKEIEQIDIFVALSRQESFGVAVLEAGAAGRPVVVSDAGGLAEVVRHGITGIVVPREAPVAAADALLELLRNPEKQLAMAAAAKRHVRDLYAWDTCVKRMLAAYDSTLRACKDQCRRS